MFHRLLVPLDGSGFGEEILPFAELIARGSGADVAVAHVHVPHVPDHLISNTQYQFEGVDLAEYEERDRAEEEAYIRRVADRLGTRLDRPVRPLMLEGPVEEAIDAWAGAAGAPGLIVMATHGRTGFSRAWLGSVADAVVRHAPWPVLLVRPHEGSEPAREPRLRSILVTLDGSPRSERILPHAIELAVGAGASVALLRVVLPASALGARIGPLSPVAPVDTSSQGREYLEEAAVAVRARGLEVTTRVVKHTQPARAILRVVAEDAPDLVAMATHGYRGVTRAVLGSVAEKVLRGTSTPLLLLGPGVEA